MNKIRCAICGKEVDFIELHLLDEHKGFSIEQYVETYPDAPTMSELAREKMFARFGDRVAKRIAHDIRKVFGVKISDKFTEAWGYDKPRDNTPELDSAYVFEKDLLVVVLYALATPNQPTLLTGPTGAGKTSIIEQVCARLNLPFYRMGFDGDITRAEFVGQWVLLGGKEMVFKYGILARAMMEGAVIILDEWDCAHPSVSMVAQPVLEGGNLTLLETGEVIKPHPDFRIFATSNTLGQGDTTGLYNGTQPQNYASLNRFKMVEVVDYPKAAIERKIIEAKTGLQNMAPDNFVDKLIQMADHVRKAFMKNEINATMSTRAVVNIAQKLQVFGDVKRAYALAFTNALSPEDKEVCGELLQRVWGI
jgi:cobaltochelatase CobS